jgi:hypothetical protein
MHQDPVRAPIFKRVSFALRIAGFSIWSIYLPENNILNIKLEASPGLFAISPTDLKPTLNSGKGLPLFGIRIALNSPFRGIALPLVGSDTVRVAFFTQDIYARAALYC